MATCPPVPVYSEDPFIYYARYLIISLKNVYGVKNLTSPTDPGNPFVDGATGGGGYRSWNSYNDGEGAMLHDVDSQIGTFIGGDPADDSSVVYGSSITNWSTALPFYIKGPKWSVFDDYETGHWKNMPTDDTGWLNVAGGLIVHPMLALNGDRYSPQSVKDSSTRYDSLWDSWYTGETEFKDLSGWSVTQYLQFGFLLEVLDAFIHIHDERGGDFIKPGMDSFTWNQMFWYGYETKDLLGKYGHEDPRTQLAKGCSNTISDDNWVWDGELNPVDVLSNAKIKYYPVGGVGDFDAGFEVDGGSTYTPPRGQNNEGGGDVGGQPGGAISSAAHRRHFRSPCGHSVKIIDADYNAFLFWLRKALEIVEEVGATGWLSNNFQAGGAAPRLSLFQCQLTGPPYGGLVRPDPYENDCNIGIFRAMADNLYFRESPLSDILTDDALDFWNNFLQDHSVSVSLSTETLNQAIESEGVAGYCDAAEVDAPTNNIFAGVDPASCRAEPEEALGVQTYQTCIPNPDAIVPNWLNQTEAEPFFNQKTCEYSIVMLADPPDCSQEYLDSFIPGAVDKLLEYYNKETNVDFINLTSLGKVPTRSKDAIIEGSGGLYLDGLIFPGTATVRNFYIPPRPLAKTKVLITVSAEEFNRIPTKQPKVQETSPTSVYREGESSFVVFSASEMESIFDKVSYSFEIYDRFYAQWHLETGKTIKGLNFTSESRRIESFFKETDLLLRESGFSLSDLQWVEIGFSPEFKIEYVKVQKQFSSPVQIEKGFSSYISRAPMNDPTTSAYVSQLPNIKDDLMIREAVSWYDMALKYRFPIIEESYGLDISSPTVEGNEGLKEIEQLTCSAGSASGVFEPNLFGSSIQRQKWAESQISDIKGALLSQFSSNPCAIVDGKILEHQGRVDFAMQITDMTLKEYLTSDRFINDLPELLVRGRYKDLEDLYGGMLNNLGMCGLIDLIKSAVDCILNALGYDDAITLITGAAIKGMDDEFIGKFISNLSPEAQQLVIAAVNESFPQLLPLLAGFVTVVITDDEGATIEPVYDRASSYTSTDVPLGSLGDVGFVGTTTTPGSKTTELSLSTPPSRIGSLGAENRAATPQDYGQLKDVVYDLVVNELLNIDEVLNLLNNLPGAGIAISILEKIDKFCIAPPIFYPPLKEFIKLPGVNIDFCELQASITIPVIPKIKFNTISKIMIDNALRVLEELLIRLLILILKKILEIIAEELCKTRVGSDPLNLRDALKNGLCGDSDIDPSLVDAALTDLVGAMGCLTNPTAVGRLVDNVASVVTQCELVDLVNGEGSDNLYDLIIEIVRTDPVTSELSECLYDRESVHNFFKSIGVFVDLEQLCINDPSNLPVSREVCDNMGLLSTFRSVRADALREKGVDEECIEDQLCVLRDQTADDLQDLMGLLQAGIFNSVIPDILNDVTSDNPSLLPSEMPLEAVVNDNIFNNIFDMMGLSFTEDITGRRGFLNMALADSRGRGYKQHLAFQRSILGPTVFNIYGSRGTRAQPPGDEWGEGADGSKEDWNSWISERREFTEKKFWKLPFLFNPLSSRSPGDTEELSSGQGIDEGETVTTGQPPAVGGLPDKVAGHLQNSLLSLSAPFNVSSNYTTNLFWFDYDNPDSVQYTFSYDYWTDPAESEKHSWDGHRIRINMKNENWVEGGDPYEEVIAFFDIASSLDPDVADYKKSFLSEFYIDNLATPDSAFQALIQQKVSSTLFGSSGGDLFLSRYNTLEGPMVSAFQNTNQNILESLAELVASEGSVNSPFNYGFNTSAPPRIIYFHDPGEEFDGDIPGAVARYGGSEGNPPFYIKPPASKGYLKIAEGIVPEFKPCEEATEVITFPEFNSLANICSELTSKINEDPRAGLKVEGMSDAREEPFDRHLSRASLGIIEGTINATIRTYVVEVLLKALPVLKFLSLSEYNYGEMLSAFIIDKMESGMKDVGRGKRFIEKYEDYWWLFLEQVVQNYAIKVNAGIITDSTPEETEAIEYITQYIEDNWEYVSTGGGIDVVKIADQIQLAAEEGTDAVINQSTSDSRSPTLFAARKIAKKRKENWDKIFESTATIDPTTGSPALVESPIVEKCKVILRRYVRDEYDRTTNIFSDYVTPENKDINDIILQSPLLLRGAIEGAGERGPFDVPEAAYYESRVAGASGYPHPYDLKTPPIAESNTPFVLERYIVSRSSTEAATAIKRFGFVANIFDADTAWGGKEITEEDQVYFGLRIVFVPEATRISNVQSQFDYAAENITEEEGYTHKAFSSYYKNAIPLASAEILLDDIGGYAPSLYNDYLQNLVCLLVETPEYKMLFQHCFPMPRYMDLLALYCANTFVPSLARVDDGWAAKTKLFGGSDQARGGGRWIGFGRFGGMNTWRGDEGMKNSFMNTKTAARQTLEAACYTSYDYRDKDYMSPSEVYVNNMGPSADIDPGIKWWQWSSLRPPPCKKKED